MSKLQLPTALLDTLRGLISEARQQVLRRVDSIQVQTYWQIGRHIVEFEQGGQARAAYGKQLLSQLAQALTGEFGKGFDASNLRNMRLFFRAFPNCDALRHELSWTHYRLLLRVDSPQAREWYMQEAAGQHWSTRVLERQISTACITSACFPAAISKLCVPKPNKRCSHNPIVPAISCATR